MSKDLKLKDLVLEHYRKVYETDVDGLTVRVFKPLTMGKLPTYAMLSEIKNRARDAISWKAIESNAGTPMKVQWWLGNPDYGAWDAQTVRRFDPREMTLDIYFAALLIRPFSRQAYDWYVEHACVYDPPRRLVLMWDSREFDKRFGYDTSYGAYKNQKDLDKVLYSGDDVAPYDCVTDPDFDPCVDDDNVQEGFALKYRHNGDKVEIEQTWPLKPELLEKISTFLEPTAQNFLDFTKENPGILEIHYFTDLTTWEKDLEDAEDAEETE